MRYRCCGLCSSRFGKALFVEFLVQRGDFCKCIKYLGPMDDEFDACMRGIFFILN